MTSRDLKEVSANQADLKEIGFSDFPLLLVDLWPSREPPTLIRLTNTLLNARLPGDHGPLRYSGKWDDPDLELLDHRFFIHQQSLEVVQLSQDAHEGVMGVEYDLVFDYDSHDLVAAFWDTRAAMLFKLRWGGR